MSIKTASVMRGTAIFFGAAIILGIAAGWTVAQNPSRRPPQSREEMARAREAARQGGLRAAAELFGEFYLQEPFQHGGLGVATSLASVAAAGDLVALGRALTNKCYLSQDGLTITTEYQVQLLEVMRDVAPALPAGMPGPMTGPGTVITVSLPGGRVEFEGGAVAEIQTPTFHRMVNGGRYWLSLKKVLGALPSGLSPELVANGRFRLTMGSQGLFEVPEDGRPVQSSGPGKSEVAKQHHGRAVAEFIELGRTAAAEANRIAPRAQ